MTATELHRGAMQFKDYKNMLCSGIELGIYGKTFKLQIFKAK